jgi:hypothetical protein
MSLIKKLLGLFSSGKVKEKQVDTDNTVESILESLTVPFEGSRNEKSELLFQWYKRKIDNLKRFFGDFERVEIVYKGPSPELIKYCSDNDVDFPLYEKTIFGTRDEVARKQLNELFGEGKVPFSYIDELIYDSSDSPIAFYSTLVPKKARYYAGLALYRPAEVLAKVAGKDLEERTKNIRLLKIMEDASKKGVDVEPVCSILVL